MTTTLIVIGALAVLAVVGWVVFRRPSAEEARDWALHALRSHLAEGRDYRVYVGMPLDDPDEWREVRVENQMLYLADEHVDFEDITSYLVVYPNGQVVNGLETFTPLPEGVEFVEATSGYRNDLLDLSKLPEGLEYVTISYGPSDSRPGAVGYYSTTIENISPVAIRVLRFGGFSRQGNSFRLNTINGDYFSAEEFINWYDAPLDGWIAPGESVGDPNNYGGGEAYWVYYFETEDGKEFTAGALIEQ